MSDALLIVGHGSRSGHADDVLPYYVDFFRADFDEVMACYLEQEPRIDDALSRIRSDRVFVMPLLMATSPAIAVERIGPLAGVRRSWRLTRARYGAVLGAAILVGVIDAVLTVALGGVGLALSLLPYGWIGDVACQAASSLVTVPFVAGATTLVYLDLRIRTEGLDLELAVAEHFSGAR